MEREGFNKITPGPWKWVFMGSAGNYYLVGNDGEGPVTHSGPDCADGKLKQAAPDLLAACEAALSALELMNYSDAEGDAEYVLRAAIAKARAK